MDKFIIACAQPVFNRGYNLVDSWWQTMCICIQNILNRPTLGTTTQTSWDLYTSIHTLLSTGYLPSLTDQKMELSPVSTEPTITTTIYIIRKERI